MISGITAGRYITVENSSSGSYYNNSSMPMAGMLRYHSGGRVEVYDGNMWQQVSCYPTIKLDTTAESAISWAIEKQKEEEDLKKLSEEHPAVKAAVENLRRAEEQLKATIILSRDEETTS